VKDAFVLWRGLGINYEGGVLDHPARVAIHFVHRLGALCTTCIVGIACLVAWRSRSSVFRSAAAAVLIMLAAQLILGPLMVVKGFPLELATAHNAMAALLLLSLVHFNRVVWAAK